MSNVTARQVLTVAAKEIGVSEYPAGSNRQKYGAEFGDNGVPWCAVYVSWCFKHAGDIELIGGFDDYTVSMAQWFYNNKQWSNAPKVGAVVFFDFGNPNYGGRWKGIHHVGIVEAILDDGRIQTIEGNTSSGSNANGGQVQRRVRSLSNVAGFGYPKYGKVVKPVPVPDTSWAMFFAHTGNNSGLSTFERTAVEGNKAHGTVQVPRWAYTDKVMKEIHYAIDEVIKRNTPNQGK